MADTIRQNASDEAKRRIRQAEENGKRLCDLAEAEARAKNADKLQKMQEQADKMLAHNRTLAEQTARSESAAAEFRMRDAIKLILGGVNEQCQ